MKSLFSDLDLPEWQREVVQPFHVQRKSPKDHDSLGKDRTVWQAYGQVKMIERHFSFSHTLWHHLRVKERSMHFKLGTAPIKKIIIWIFCRL